MCYFIKLRKKLEFENKRSFFEFIMFYFIKLGKKLEFENKREKIFFFYKLVEEFFPILLSRFFQYP